MKEDLYIMWLTRIDTLGLKKQHILLDAFGSAEEVFKSPARLLHTVKGISPLNVNKIVEKQHDKYLSILEQELFDNAIRYISISNEEYPPLLKEIQNPPVGFYILGEMPDHSKPFISIVGSRRCTEYGLSVTHNISKDLVLKNVIIVSGMAKGIDSMAHKGAMDGGGKTIAVLGCGLDVCYPPENKHLRDRIAKNGCLISEFPPKTKPMAANFPARNRIISGLSLGLIVVEATLKSGTLITVELALEQGREVMAIPGCINSNFSQGTNELIKQGAALVSNSEDVLNYLGIDIEANNLYNSINIDEILSVEEKMIFDCIDVFGTTFEYIIDKVSAQAQTVSYILTMLELKGVIRKLPGQKYIRRV